MESVLTMIERCRKPEEQLENFIAILDSFKDVVPVFSNVITEFSQAGYWLENRRARKRLKADELHHHGINWRSKQAKLDSSPERNTTKCQQQPQASQSIPDDDSFKRHLRLRYQKIELRLRSGCRSRQTRRQEWKFFSLEAVFPHKFKCSLDLHCLPQSDHIGSDHPSRTLITGNAGVGKSSIAVELCKQWSDRALLKCYDYVILIRAKDCKAAHDLKDLIPRKEWRALVEETDDANTLFIIDGYDEFTEESRKPDGFLDRFIQGNVLPEASIIVTARPWCAKQILPYFPSGEVEILGFTPKSRIEYVTRHLGSKHASKILQAVPKHNNFSSIPFILTTLVDIYNQAATQDHDHADHGTFTKAAAFETHSSMYGFLISAIVSYYAKNTNSLSKFIHGSCITVADGEFIKLPHHIYLPFLKVCILAYKLLLTPDDVNAADLQYDVETFDLFCVEDPESDFRQNSFYKFLHSSVQEYLAAYCISRMEKSSMDVCIRNLRKSYRYQLIIEFLYGFGCIREVTNISAIYHRQTEEINSFTVLRQVCESKNSQTLIKDAFGRQEKSIIKRTYPHPSPHDFRCLGKVIAHSKCEWELGFTYRGVTNDHLEMFAEGIRSNKRPISRMTTMGLSFNDIDDEGLNSLIRLPKPYLEHVKELRLNSNHFTSAVIPDLCFTLEGDKFEKLEKFLFHHNYITPAGSHSRLIESLAPSCPHLRHVSFTGLLPNECRLLLRKLKRLKVIELWQISTESCECVFVSLPESNSIQQLEIYQCNITFNTIKNLPQTLPESTNLKCLKLNNCNIDNTSSLVIADAAKTSQLESLDLSNNVIEDLGGRNLIHLRDDYRIDLKDTYKCNNFSRKIQLKLMPQQPGFDPCFSTPTTLTTGSRKRVRRYFSTTDDT